MYIFMNINENIGNKRKSNEKLYCKTTQLLFIIHFKILYQIKTWIILYTCTGMISILL